MIHACSDRLRDYPLPAGARALTPARKKAALPPMRLYSAAWLTDTGDIGSIQRPAPAIREFERGFAAFARGVLIATEHGPVAIEDLLPGTRVRTVRNGLCRLRWIGSMLHVPGIAARDGARWLTRIAADSFGLGRPMPDLLIGPGARLVRPGLKSRSVAGGRILTRELADDSDNLVRVNPTSPVRLYHIAFDAPQVIRANGLKCEAFHPETMVSAHFGADMRALFLSMFPHAGRPDPARNRPYIPPLPPSADALRLRV